MIASVERVLQSGKWSISSPATSYEGCERRFARAFAEYNGVEFCVPASHGTAALTIALEACGVGAGDEVITPALSWVASASAVLAVNAVPVLVDVEPETLCLDAEAAEASITPRTRAIVVVHLYSAVADLKRLLALANRRGLAVIEDCSQAHGAEYLGRKVGGFGAAGIFSMHQTKILTCGEGGAAITSDPDVARRMLRLRSDGRDHREPSVEDHGWSLVESGDPMGANFALSEIHAAMLLAQLPLLDEQISRRGAALALLGDRLAGAGIAIQGTSQGTTRRSPFALPIKVPTNVRRHDPRDVAALLWRTLRVPTRLAYPSIGRSPLYTPSSRRRFRISTAHLARVLAAARQPTPHADAVAAATIVLPHPLLLAEPWALDDLATVLIEALQPG